jgi:uncharacterized protein (TIGR03067 family)
VRSRIVGAAAIFFCGVVGGCNRNAQESAPEPVPVPGDAKQSNSPPLVVAGDLDPDRKAADQASLTRGTWLCVEAVNNGTERTDPGLLSRINMRFTFGPDGALENRSQDQVQKGSYRIDPSKRPKELDLTLDGKTAKCVYCLEGDVLAIVIGDEASRPADVALPPGSKWALAIYRRIHPVK